MPYVRMIWDIVLVCLLGYLAVFSWDASGSMKMMGDALVHVFRGGDLAIDRLLIQCEATQLPFAETKNDGIITLYY